MTKNNSQQTSLTLFDGIGDEEYKKAVEALISGKTPSAEIRERTIPGGSRANYVNAYWMTRQISLLTGFKWSSCKLSEKWWPNEDDPQEYECEVRITIYDPQGNPYSHESTGGAVVLRDKQNKILSRINTKKTGYTDGIKKCLSYFGIANDVYGRKDLSEDFFESNEEESGEIDWGGSDAQKAFTKHLQKRGVRPSEAFTVLGVPSMAEITDFKEARDRIDNWKDNKNEEVTDA